MRPLRILNDTSSRWRSVRSLTPPTTDRAGLAAREGRAPTTTPTPARQRYCGPCERWLAWRHRECPACGAETDYVRAEDY